MEGKNILHSIRLEFQDVETLEKQTVYISYINPQTFRVKVFAHGKMTLKKDMNTDSIAFIIKRIMLLLKTEQIIQK